MAVIFKQDNLGKSIGFKIDGAEPVHRISLGVDNDLPVTGDATDAVYRSLKGYLRDTYNYGVEQVNELIKSGKILSNAAFNSSDLKTIKDILASGGLRKIPKPIAYARSGLGYIAADEETRRRTMAARMSLDQIIQPLGMVTGISLQFTDPVNAVGITIEAGANQQLYSGTISGISFSGSCKQSTSTHGLEPLLEYFYHHRVTNANKDLTKTTLKVGATVLRGWVVGFSAEPLNLDYRIWSWAIQLMISPVYRPSTSFKGPAPSAADFVANRLRQRTAGRGESQ